MFKIISRQSGNDSKLVLIIIIFLLANTVMLGFGLQLLNAHLVEQEQSELGYRQEMARDFLNYNRRLATNLGVLERRSVKEALAEFNYDIDLASSSDELTQIVLNHGRRAQEIIVREWDSKLREDIVAVVNNDPLVRDVEGEKHVTLRISEEEGVHAEPAEIIDPLTLEVIKEEHLPLSIPTQEVVIDLEIKEGRVSQIVPYNPLDLVQALSEELDDLRLQLHETRSLAGFSDLSGAGVVIKLYDAPNGHTTGTIIHDTDVRDLVNELFVSGAQGVAVGGQRLTANSSIRCVGSLIKVNDKHVSVNPVTIEAVGEPEILESGLDILRSTWDATRGIEIEIEQEENVTLPGYN